MTDHFALGFPVLFRRHKGAHEERGKVVSRTFGRPPCRYSVETPDGDRIDAPYSIEADEETLARHRESELAAITGDAA